MSKLTKQERIYRHQVKS